VIGYFDVGVIVTVRCRRVQVAGHDAHVVEGEVGVADRLEFQTDRAGHVARVRIEDKRHFRVRIPLLAR